MTVHQLDLHYARRDQSTHLVLMSDPLQNLALRHKGCHEPNPISIYKHCIVVIKVGILIANYKTEFNNILRDHFNINF